MICCGLVLVNYTHSLQDYFPGTDATISLPKSYYINTKIRMIQCKKHKELLNVVYFTVYTTCLRRRRLTISCSWLNNQIRSDARTFTGKTTGQLESDTSYPIPIRKSLQNINEATVPVYIPTQFTGRIVWGMSSQNSIRASEYAFCDACVGCGIEPNNYWWIIIDFL